MSCLLGMTKLMADHPGQWNGTLLALFQPAEDTGDGAQGMLDDGLLTRIPAPDIALAQHVLRGVAGQVPTVLTSGLYAIPALIGAAIAVLGAAAACFLIRLAGIRYHINAPIAREDKDDEEKSKQ